MKVSNGDGQLDKTTTTLQVAPGVVDTQVDNNNDGRADLSSLKVQDVSYNLLDQYQRSNAEYALNQLRTEGGLGLAYWEKFTQDSSRYLLSSGSAGSSGLGLNLPPSGSTAWLNPIGAFYDSQSTAHGNAASIAAYTPVVLDQNQQCVSATLEQMRGGNAANEATWRQAA